MFQNIYLLFLFFLFFSYSNISFKRQPHKMVRHTQTIRRQHLTSCLSVFDHFVELALKGLMFNKNNRIGIKWTSEAY